MSNTSCDKLWLPTDKTGVVLRRSVDQSFELTKILPLAVENEKKQYPLLKKILKNAKCCFPKAMPT